MSLGTEKKGFMKKNVTDSRCKSNITVMLLLKNISHPKIPRHSGIAVNLPSLSTIKMFQIVEQIKVVKVVLPEVSNLNESAMNKNHRDQTVSSMKKASRKRKNGT